MEALVALGFAANVVQFVDFSTRVISQTVRIYRTKSKSGVEQDATNLDEIGLRIKEQTAPLKLDDMIKSYLNNEPWNGSDEEPNKTIETWKMNSTLLGQPRFENLNDMNTKVRGLFTQTNAVTKLSATDRDILRTSVKCEEIALLLQEALCKLKNTGGSKSTMWNSFVEALRTIWGEEQITALRLELDSYRKQMNSLLLLSVREKVVASQLSAKQLQEDLYTTTSAMRATVDLLLSTQEQWKLEIIHAIRNSHKRSLGSVQTDVSPETRSTFDRHLRRWVRFSEMDRRYDKIATAHKETFEWVFRRPRGGKWSDFPRWLEDENESLYWITGKPAAGKSTLLKFIYNDERKLRHLEKWAGQKRLVTCAFYFWNSGTPMQMSTEGMRRTLLHSALRGAPELATELFPSKMEEFIVLANPWSPSITGSEVDDAFHRLLEGAGSYYRLFIFIDGLDEFGGDHNDLIDFIRSFSSPDIKACVSSRSWPVFEDAFQDRPRLRLEALTYADIKHYVTSRFSESPGYRERQLETPVEIENLTEEITQKASGVFLWVQLVTDSLLKGLTAGERLEELQRRLDSLPVDLGDLFWRILTQVDDGYRTNMAQMFQLMKQAPEPLTVLDMSYADSPDPDIVAKTQYNRPSAPKAEGRALRTRRRLKTCCKGLLDAEADSGKPLASSHVTYLHRTVRDYIKQPEIWTRFLELTGDDFVLARRQYNLHAIHIKAINACEFDFWVAMLYAIDAAIRVAPENVGGTQVKLLIQLDHIGQHCAAGGSSNATPHWSSLRQGLHMNTSFLHLAIQLQLHHYVRHALALEPVPLTGSDVRQREDAIMLLMATHQCKFFARDSDMPRVSIISKTISVELIKLLLSRGSDPNYPIKDSLRSYNFTGDYSTWAVHLNVRKRTSRTWITISTLLLEHGADPTLVNASTPGIPNEIVDLAQQKTKEWGRKKRKNAVGSMFKMGKWIGL